MATKHAGSANVYEINNGLFHKMELLPELVTGYANIGFLDFDIFINWKLP